VNSRIWHVEFSLGGMNGSGKTLAVAVVKRLVGRNE
jgi:hypothetical protein